MVTWRWKQEGQLVGPPSGVRGDGDGDDDDNGGGEGGEHCEWGAVVSELVGAIDGASGEQRRLMRFHGSDA